ncbi:MAG: hypothetical protein ACSHX6_15225 [Akkermansiaceae bacterium]
MSDPFKNKGLRKPYLTMPGATGMPNMKDFLSSMPKEREHRFESAGEFITRLANRVTKWRNSLPEDEIPVVLTFLPTGDVVEVITVGEDGHSSVVIEGLVNDSPCMFISHQASLQILCYTRKVVDEEGEEEEPKKKRTIGFHVGGEEIEA